MSLNRLRARERRASAGVLQVRSDSARRSFEQGRPVPMGAYFEYASGGGWKRGSFLKSCRWMGYVLVRRCSRGGEKIRRFVVRSSGRVQERRYTGNG